MGARSNRKQVYFKGKASSLIQDIAENESDRVILRAIKDITGRGNDAEVKRRRDGTLAVYEVKKNIAVG